MKTQNIIILLVAAAAAYWYFFMRKTDDAACTTCGANTEENTDQTGVEAEISEASARGFIHDPLTGKFKEASHPLR